MSEEKKERQNDIYEPSSKLKKKANVKEYDQLYNESITNREEFWAKQAKSLNWYRKWDKVLDNSTAPFYKWFTGGKINIIHNAVEL